jgi:Cytochrome c554 and c-prime
MQRTYYWGMGLAAAAVVLGVVVGLRQPHPPAASRNDESAAFLQGHWRVPIPLQGPPPATYSPLEASLQPQDCGLCHPQQYQDWRSSLHSRSMGPGVSGQLLEMDAATATLCATCHTPLSEQLPQREQGGEYQQNPAFDAQLQQAGLVCAACHVRHHQRFGPPRRPELPPLTPGTVLPHGGFTESVAFQQAEFCQSCHQFTPDDVALNGKLIENTYEEWRQSPYAQAGVQCQTCHMPDRRHLWRGIHDVEMVQQAMAVTVTPNASAYRPGDQMQVVITVTNVGAGHYLPTYVTPKIVVHAHLLDAQGQVLPDSAQEAVIGREVTLDLSEELSDTRIPPKASRAFPYTTVLPAAAVTLRVRVVVHPDHFYQRFFAATLQDRGGGTGRAQLEEALRRTQASPFTAFEQTLPLRTAE